MHTSSPHPLIDILGTPRLLHYVFNWCKTLAYQPPAVIQQMGNYLARSSHIWSLVYQSTKVKTPKGDVLDILTTTEEVELLAIVWPTKSPTNPLLFFGPSASADNLHMEASLKYPAEPTSPVFLVKAQNRGVLAVTIASNDAQLLINEPSLTRGPNFMAAQLADGTILLPHASSGTKCTPTPGYNIGLWEAYAEIRALKTHSTQQDSFLVPNLSLTYRHPVHGVMPPLYLNMCCSLADLTNEAVQQGLDGLFQALRTFLITCETVRAAASDAGIPQKAINYRKPSTGQSQTQLQAAFRFVLQHNPEIIQNLTIYLEQPNGNEPHSRLRLYSYRDITQGPPAHRRCNDTWFAPLNQPIREATPYLFTELIAGMQITMQTALAC